MASWLDKLRARFRSSAIEVGGDESSLKVSRKRINLQTLIIDSVKLIIGGVIIALAIDLFIAPHNIAPGGASGLAIIITEYISFPLGLTMLAINIPAYLLGYRYLGGGSFLIRSLVATVVYNLSVDLLAPWLPREGLTDQMILNAIFGGVIGGFGAGLIYQSGGTAGAGGVTNRLFRKWLGLPIKITTFYTNGLVIGLAALTFGWEAAMYALISFFISGTTADFVMEGPDVVRTAMIITDHPDKVARAIMEELERGVTRWQVQGEYSGDPHTALYCTVSRAEVHAVKSIVAWADPDAFVIIGKGHEALGSGFHRLEEPLPVLEDVSPVNEQKEVHFE